MPHQNKKNRTALIVGGGCNVAAYSPFDYDLYCVVNQGIKEVNPDVCLADIWFSGILPSHEKAYGITTEIGNMAKVLVRTSVEDTTAVTKFNPQWKDKAIFVPKNEYKQLRDRVRPKKPTTGLVGIWYLMSRVNEVFITGFDGYATPNRFVGHHIPLPTSHNFEKERVILDLLLKTANVTELK